MPNTTGKCRWSKRCSNSAAPERIYCHEHLERNRVKAKRTYYKRADKISQQVKQRRYQNKIHGLCVWCGSPTSPGYSYCETHLQIRADNEIKCHNNGIRTRATKRNPLRTDWIIKRLWTYEPYLRQDWNTAEPWIRQHIELWTTDTVDNVLIKSVELKELTHMFNVYLDGQINYLENGIRLAGELPDYDDNQTLQHTHNLFAGSEEQAQRLGENFNGIRTTARDNQRIQ